jgi:hypothetical protein
MHICKWSTMKVRQIGHVRGILKYKLHPLPPSHQDKTIEKRAFKPSSIPSLPPNEQNISTGTIKIDLDSRYFLILDNEIPRPFLKICQATRDFQRRFHLFGS